MSGTAAVVTSPDAVTGGNAAWDYAVPLGQEVGADLTESKYL